MTFLARARGHREKLLKNTATQAHPQRTITTFFSPITPTNAISQSRDTQMGPRLGHWQTSCSYDSTPQPHN